MQITDLLAKMQARKVLIVSDSCYGGAMAFAEWLLGDDALARKICVQGLEDHLLGFEVQSRDEIDGALEAHVGVRQAFESREQMRTRAAMWIGGVLLYLVALLLASR